MYNTRPKRNSKGKILHEVRWCVVCSCARVGGGVCAIGLLAPPLTTHFTAHTHETNNPTQELQSKDLPTTRIQPDRRWFGNTRVIGQRQLEQFREQMSAKVNDAYAVLLREKKLPLQLLDDPERRGPGAKALRAGLLSATEGQPPLDVQPGCAPQALRRNSEARDAGATRLQSAPGFAVSPMPS